MKPTVELDANKNQNDEPYVTLNFGPQVTPEQARTADRMAKGFGLSCGYGPGLLSDAVRAGQTLARRLRRLGWSVSMSTSWRNRL